jgi:hypothetical protein
MSSQTCKNENCLRFPQKYKQLNVNLYIVKDNTIPMYYDVLNRIAK